MIRKREEEAVKRLIYLRVEIGEVELFKAVFSRVKQTSNGQRPIGTTSHTHSVHEGTNTII